jgi:hypothetical protein
MKVLGRRRGFITLLGGGLAVFIFEIAAAQEGYYGVGHDKWHQNFYSKLKRNDGKGSCCNLMDCRPTQSRMVGDHYEVKVDGELECALDGGQFQAAVLTGCWAWRSSYCAGLR